MIYENYLEKYIVCFIYVMCNIRKIFLSQYYFNILVRYIYLYMYFYFNIKFHYYQTLTPTIRSSRTISIIY